MKTVQEEEKKKKLESLFKINERWRRAGKK